jgi:hypothetical protein
MGCHPQKGFMLVFWSLATLGCYKKHEANSPHSHMWFLLHVASSLLHHVVGNTCQNQDASARLFGSSSYQNCELNKSLYKLSGLGYFVQQCKINYETN